MSSPNFIFLNDQAARVTSLTPIDATGGFSLVVIARGGADRDQLMDLLNAKPLTVRLDQEPEQLMRTTGVDVRSVGEGPQAVHRIQASLVPSDSSISESPPPARVPDQRTPIEHRLDTIIDRLTEIRDRL